MIQDPIDVLRDHTGKFPAFTSVGCYPLVYITRDCSVLCPECANGGNTSGADDPDFPDWLIASGDVHWEGPPMQCDNCNDEIESAYGDPDATDGDS